MKTLFYHYTFSLNSANNKKFIFKYFLLLLCICLFNNVKAQSFISKLNNSVAVSDTLIQFNTKLNVEKKVTFKIKNTYNRPISIKSVLASCGCTIPEYNRKPININEYTELDVIYKAPEIGLFDKLITIGFSHTNVELKVKIKGTVTK